MGRSSGPEVSITNFGDCKRVHRESVRFVREFSWFVFVPFPTIWRGSVSFASFPRVKSFAWARRREIGSIQEQNCSTRSTRRLHRAPLSASPRRISSLIVWVYTRGKNLRLPENSYETVRLVAEYLGQCTRNLSIHAARLHRKRLYYTCWAGTEDPGSGGEGGKGDREGVWNGDKKATGRGCERETTKKRRTSE